jgi:hypothetical protein
MTEWSGIEEWYRMKRRGPRTDLEELHIAVAVEKMENLVPVRLT